MEENSVLINVHTDKEKGEGDATEWTIVTWSLTCRTTSFECDTADPTYVVFFVFVDLGVRLLVVRVQVFIVSGRDACVPAPLGDGVPTFDDDFH